MATRFGSSRKAHHNYPQKYWLLGGLLTCFFLILNCVFFLLLETSQTNATSTVKVPADSANLDNDTIEVISAAIRIEEGSRLNENMLRTDRYSRSLVPYGTAQAKDIASVKGKFTTVMLEPGVLVRFEQLSEKQPISTLHIPPGYRAATILVDNRAGVDGWARPNKRVDVLFTGKNKHGRSMVKTIVGFAKILSVAGDNKEQGNAKRSGQTIPVTLQVTIEDSMLLELARHHGSLSLTLVGDIESPGKGSKGKILIVDDFFKEVTDGECLQGRAYVTDSKTGRQLSYSFCEGEGWKADNT